MFDVIEIARSNGVVLNRIDGFNKGGRFPAAYSLNNCGEVQNYIIDDSRGWETMRHDFARAARDYNELVPIEAAIPTF